MLTSRWRGTLTWFQDTPIDKVSQAGSPVRTKGAKGGDPFPFFPRSRYHGSVSLMHLVPGTPYPTAWANSGKSRREQALRLMAFWQACLNKLGLSALATRERSTGERRRVERNKL